MMLIGGIRLAEMNCRLLGMLMEEVRLGSDGNEKSSLLKSLMFL